jgi:hypothetical protein
MQQLSQPLHHLIIEDVLLPVRNSTRSLQHIRTRLLEIAQQEVGLAAGKVDLNVELIEVALTVGLQRVLESTVLEQHMPSKFVDLFILRSQG